MKHETPDIPAPTAAESAADRAAALALARLWIEAEQSVALPPPQPSLPLNAKPMRVRNAFD
jgi:hypothetical protein